jgi:hypothetical protein
VLVRGEQGEQLAGAGQVVGLHAPWWNITPIGPPSGFEPATALDEGFAAELEWVQRRTAPLPPVRSLTAS